MALASMKALDWKASLDFSTREVLNSKNKHAKLEAHFGPNMAVCKQNIFADRSFFLRVRHPAFRKEGQKRWGKRSPTSKLSMGVRALVTGRWTR